MRRHEKEMTSRADIEAVIRRAMVCRLAVCEDNRPYVVPLCFGYKDDALYFHCSRQGKKLDILRRNNNVCFEVDIDCEIVKADRPCDWGMKYESVIGYGKAVFIEDAGQKRKALDIIMQQYSNGEFGYPEEAIKNTVVIKIEIETMTGKQSG
ncbi:MAG: pyridoxamine 5'-phosphate oxidase family protein [Planctomycetes bacterium]|nr:pyridoxamine 5'-phosphate oxidase family protein [Planctomycetota bacterium]